VRSRSPKFASTGAASTADHVPGLPVVDSAIAVATNRERHRELISTRRRHRRTEMFFIFIMVVHNNPFDTFHTCAD
jgi:hypothetical protein